MLNNLRTFISIPVIESDGLKALTDSIMPTLIVAVLVVFIVLELKTNGNRQARRELLQSYRTNISTLIFNDILMAFCSISSLLFLAENFSRYGVLSSLNYPLQIICSVLILDLIKYIWHRACHQFDSLWRFHKVHHSDKSVNASTAFRVHFVELILTTLVKAAFILLSGVEALVVAFIEGLSALMVIYHHTSLRSRIEWCLGWLFVVPGMHRGHHSVSRQQHDSNYGAIFSFWDRLFNTFSRQQPKAIGLAHVEALNFLGLLKFGFVGNSATDSTVAQSDLDDMIAEAAYYHAEHRDFISGYEILDWLNAEKEIKALRDGELKLC